MKRKQYTTTVRDRKVVHEGFRSPWDTVYFALINSDNPEQKISFKSFDVWCELRDYVPSLQVLDRTTGNRFKSDVHLRTKKRKNGVGDPVRYQVYDAHAYYIKNSLKDLFQKLDEEIEDHKKSLKKDWDRQNNLRKKKELEEVLKNRNISAEEYKREKAAERKAASYSRTAGESVERTKRILKMAPMLTNIRDEIDVVLKQFNEGRGEVGRYKNKIDKLHYCMNVIKSLRTK